MAGQQEVRYSLADGILVAAVSTGELALDKVRLHEQAVEVLGELLVRLEGLRRGGFLWKLGEAELRVC